MTDADFEAAAAAIAGADAMIIGTGAGMGVDSGLGTFRGRNAGVWEPLKAMQIDFSEMSCPNVFEEDPRAAWAFWHFRYSAYTGTEPHEGYRLLAKWGASMAKGCFSITSNIDGHWVRTIGEERTVEKHGALTHMQRMDEGGAIWPTDPAAMSALHVPPWDLQPREAVEVKLHGEWETEPAVVADDGATILRFDADGIGGPIKVEGVRRANGPDLCRVTEESRLPVDGSGAAVRPNVLMFGDGYFQWDRIKLQEERYEQWLASLGPEAKVVIVEVGAGTAVPTIRMECERLVLRTFRRRQATLVRINIDQSFVPRDAPAIGIGGHGALEALRKLDALVQLSSGARGSSP